MSNFAEIRTAVAVDAFRALVGEWHDINEAGCCGPGDRCAASAEWARGYLAAIADWEEEVEQ